MDRGSLSLLTDKERQALRLVPLHGTLGEIARELSISESAVKQRLASASRKLGADGRRHKAARILMEAEGWPYPERTGPDCQVEPSDDQAIPEPVHERHDDDPDPPAMVRPTIMIPALGVRIDGLGGRNGLTVWQRVVVIAVMVLLGLLIFSMVIATLTETGRFKRAMIEQQKLERSR